MASEKDVIKLRVENVISGSIVDDGSSDIFNEQVGTLPSQANAKQSQNVRVFTGAISAEMFISSFGQIVGAAGGQELAGFMGQAAEIGFTGATALTGNVPAMFSLLTKFGAIFATKISENCAKLKEIANQYNDITMMKLQTGQLVITNNTQISYDKYGRISIRDRK
jgi:hypothetical protein